MVSQPSAQALAIACGAAGAYVDVTDDLITDTIGGTWGRTTAFSDTRPGVFSFDLVNDDGKYTPGNAFSSLSTTVRVGMGVSHIVDGMHFSGTIRSAQPYFTGPASLAGSSKVRITCDDALGGMSRQTIADLPDDAVTAATRYLEYTFEDFAGDDVLEVGGAPTVRALHNLASFTIDPAAPGVPIRGGTQLQITGNPAGGELVYNTPVNSVFPVNSYPAGSAGCYGIWLTRYTSESGSVAIANSSMSIAGTFLEFSIANVSGQVSCKTPGGTILGSMVPSFGEPVYLSARLSMPSLLLTVEFFANGVLQGSNTYFYGTTFTDAERSPKGVAIRTVAGSGVTPIIRLSHLTHTETLVDEYVFGTSTEAARAAALDTISDASFTIPTDLSTAPIGPQSAGGRSALDLLNDIIRTEQGYVWVETTGTLTAPIPTVTLRSRERSDTVVAGFSITEILNAPEFTTDIENMVSATTVRGTSDSVTVTAPTLIPYVGSASDSANVLLDNTSDLVLWGQDRILRGVNTDVRLLQFTVDALALNRWADISALRAGDRVQITDLPIQQLGVDTLDGWLIGSSYALRYPALHGDDAMLFTFTMQPVLPRTAVFDTDRFMADGALTLSAGINASVTTMSVATTGPKLETVVVPYSLLLDSEEVTVTACTGATPQVATIVRGANGTTAAAHTTSAVIESTPPALYAF